jgi:hypothetical protein
VQRISESCPARRPGRYLTLSNFLDTDRDWAAWKEEQMGKLSIPCRTRLAMTGIAVGVPLALTACGHSSPAASAPASAPAESAAVPAVSVPTVHVPKYIPADNARKAITATACLRDGAKGWLARGTATNPTSAARSYSIVIDFATTKGDTVMDTKIVRVRRVPPKASAHWSALGAAGQSNITCVIREALARP